MSQKLMVRRELERSCSDWRDALVPAATCTIMASSIALTACAPRQPSEMNPHELLQRSVEQGAKVADIESLATLDGEGISAVKLLIAETSYPTIGADSLTFSQATYAYAGFWESFARFSQGSQMSEIDLIRYLNFMDMVDVVLSSYAQDGVQFDSSSPVFTNRLALCRDLNAIVMNPDYSLFVIALEGVLQGLESETVLPGSENKVETYAGALDRATETTRRVLSSYAQDLSGQSPQEFSDVVGNQPASVNPAEVHQAIAEETWRQTQEYRNSLAASLARNASSQELMLRAAWIRYLNATARDQVVADNLRERPFSDTEVVRATNYIRTILLLGGEDFKSQLHLQAAFDTASQEMNLESYLLDLITRYYYAAGVSAGLIEVEADTLFNESLRAFSQNQAQIDLIRAFLYQQYSAARDEALSFEDFFQLVLPNTVMEQMVFADPLDDHLRAVATREGINSISGVSRVEFVNQFALLLKDVLSAYSNDLLSLSPQVFSRLSRMRILGPDETLETFQQKVDAAKFSSEFYQELAELLLQEQGARIITKPQRVSLEGEGGPSDRRMFHKMNPLSDLGPGGRDLSHNIFRYSTGPVDYSQLPSETKILLTIPLSGDFGRSDWNTEILTYDLGKIAKSTSGLDIEGLRMVRVASYVRANERVGLEVVHGLVAQAEDGTRYFVYLENRSQRATLLEAGDTCSLFPVEFRRPGGVYTSDLVDPIHPSVQALWNELAISSLEDLQSLGLADGGHQFSNKVVVGFPAADYWLDETGARVPTGHVPVYLMMVNFINTAPGEVTDYEGVKVVLSAMQISDLLQKVQDSTGQLPPYVTRLVMELGWPSGQLFKTEYAFPVGSSIALLDEKGVLPVISDGDGNSFYIVHREGGVLLVIPVDAVYFRSSESRLADILRRYEYEIKDYARIAFFAAQLQGVPYLDFVPIWLIDFFLNNPDLWQFLAWGPQMIGQKRRMSDW